MPVFYKDNMYRKEEDRVYLKLWDGKDWTWQEVRLKKTDLDYLRKNWSDVQKSRQKLHMWKKSSVQKITEHKAHRLGMRVSRVCAWNTSALAYDGSGEVRRDPGNRSLAVFTNGKQDNSDLSASYNIGARYLIREHIKPVPETERSALEAKVPAVRRRTSCVYADLLALIRVMGESA